MNQISIWLEQGKDVAAKLVHAFLLYLPSLFAALVILVVGWIIARLVRSACLRLAGGLNRVLSHMFSSKDWSRIRLSDGAAKVIANIVFWLVILFVVDAAAKVAKFDFFVLWLDRVLTYLPNLLAGALITFIGYLLSTIIRDVVTVAFAPAGAAQSRMLGFVAQFATFVAALIVGLGQAGIDVTLLVTIVSVLVAAAAASFTLAFGFGAQTYVSNLIGAYQVQRHFRSGNRVRIGDIEGEVLEISATSIVLATQSGRVTIPGKAFHEGPISLIPPENANG